MTKVLSELRYSTGGRYRFTLTGDLTVNLGKGWVGCHILRDGATEWATLRGDVLTIMAGYSFDGCSPAWQVFGKWFGTPTPHNAVAACCVHDVLRGYLGLDCLHYTRQDTDDLFYDFLRDAGFPLEGIYHGAVAGFWGSLYIRLTAARPWKGNCKCHLPP